jgi:hypothetical protein
MCRFMSQEEEERARQTAENQVASLNATISNMTGRLDNLSNTLNDLECRHDAVVRERDQLKRDAESAGDVAKYVSTVEKNNEVMLQDLETLAKERDESCNRARMLEGRLEEERKRISELHVSLEHTISPYAMFSILISCYASLVTVLFTCPYPCFVTYLPRIYVYTHKRAVYCLLMRFSLLFFAIALLLKRSAHGDI